MEINRGTNALLFGAGTPAGIINPSTAVANPGRQSGSGDLSCGSAGRLGAALGYNLVAKNGELPIRVAAVRSDDKFQQEFTYNKIDRR